MTGAGGSGSFGIFTVDVEDWYHPLIKDPDRWREFEDRVVAPTDRLLSMLQSNGSHGTFFVLGTIAERHPDLVQRILAGGHEVGCHGYHHLSLEWLDPARFRADLVRAMAALRQAGAGEIVSFRAPYFSVNQGTAWALDVLADEGFLVDSSVFPLRTGYYGQRRANNGPHRWGRIHEFPITLPQIAGLRVPLTGGFYSRLFPPSWIAAGVQRVVAAGEEPMFYIHPWELDPGQPRIRVGRFLTYRHYLRLDRTEDTIALLLRRWRWRTLRESLAAQGGHD